MFGVTPELHERRKSKQHDFDVAATLELNLDRHPSRPAMLTFLRTVLYCAEAGDFAFGHPGYVEALKRAVDVLEHSTDPLEAAATLQGYQAYMGRRGPQPH